MDQNSALKKEAGIAERKLLARNERIQNLETLLQDADRRLAIQNQKFETQLQSVKERLEQARGKVVVLTYLVGHLRIEMPSAKSVEHFDIELWSNREATPWRRRLCCSFRDHWCFYASNWRRTIVGQSAGQDSE